MSDKETFVDPLENYDPKTYADPLEKADRGRETVSEIQHKPHASIDPDSSVAEAVRMLASEHVACLLVEEEGRLVGVFTDREVLNKVALEEANLDKPIRDVMTTGAGLRLRRRSSGSSAMRDGCEWLSPCADR